MKRLQHLCDWICSHSVKCVRRRSILTLSCAFIIVIILRWMLMCSNTQSLILIKNICTSYTNGQSVGSLCQNLCQPEVVDSLTCHNFYKEKETVFTVKWKNTSVVFKSVKKQSSIETEPLHWLDVSNNKIYPSEKDLEHMIKTTIKFKFNISIKNVDLKKITYTKYNPGSEPRHIEMDNIWSLIQDNEYLALVLYEKYDIFPKLIGTCGDLYAVQKLNSISGYWHLMTLYDSQDEWDKRIKISIKILDFLLQLESRLPEPVLICNVKMNHFGVTDDSKKIKYLDLDSVHPVSIVNRMTGDGSYCKQHSDCDFLDCRSFCNLITMKCEHGVINNNLQIVCERIFLGWVMSGRVMVPGLLLGPRTPRVLTELLEMCANPSSETGTPRAKATEEIRKRLYNLLIHLTSI